MASLVTKVVKLRTNGRACRLVEIAPEYDRIVGRIEQLVQELQAAEQAAAAVGGIAAHEQQEAVQKAATRAAERHQAAMATKETRVAALENALQA
jgi:hypothetical protein